MLRGNKNGLHTSLIIDSQIASASTEQGDLGNGRNDPSKKETRSTTFYEVYLHWLQLHRAMWLGKERSKVSREPEKNIPSSLIAEFESATVPTTVDERMSSGLGQTMHTLVVVPASPHHQLHDKSSQRVMGIYI